MGRTRVEAFSDGVIAILITIMVLELRVPHDPTLASLRSLAPVFSTYILSFAFLAIYWNNHHHLLHTVKRVSGGMLWANAMLLFWLSLVPFVTGWMGQNNFAPIPTALYGGVLICAAVSYTVLQATIIRIHGPESRIAVAVGSDWKGKASIGLCALAIPLAFVERWLSCAIYVMIAILWLVPDRRIESHLID
jgi:uncharacterized membrane protein